MLRTASRPAPAPAVTSCLHCGDHCDRAVVATRHGTFCCEGCAAVFDVLQGHHLGAFYACDVAPGVTQRHKADLDPARFAALDDPDVAAHLIEFEDGRLVRATLSIPSMHCASCVWLLEQFWRIDAGATRTEVDLQRRTLRIEFNPALTSLRRIADRLASLGYEPVVSPERMAAAPPSGRRRLHLQIGVAGFAFGNIMLFSIPQYLNGAPIEGGFQRMFDTLNLALAIPVLVFSAADYFRAAWLAARHRAMTLEVPVAIGLAALFVRSVAEIATGHGEGFLDSFAGLVFFLLLGRLFQQKVFDAIAFDRTYRSFLPLSVRVERDGGVTVVPLERLQPGDVIRLRRHEIVPADASLQDDDGAVDYAFITGEQTLVSVRRDQTVRAGGRAATAMRLRVRREVSQSHLASLWNNPLFHRVKPHWLAGVSAAFGGWFTAGATGLAVAGAVAWWPDAAASASVATAVLIVACPCALTLSAPITLGTAMGQLGRRGLYLKQPAVALDLSRIDMVVFDKTGTLTAGGAGAVVEKQGLSERGWGLARRLALESTHPASRAIAAACDPGPAEAGHERSAVRRAIEPGTEPRAIGPDEVTRATWSGATPRSSHVRDVAGQGVSGLVDGEGVAIGSAAFVARCTGRPTGADDRTHVVAGHERGWFRLSAVARPGLEEAATRLAGAHDVWLVSGDHDAERSRWSRVFGQRMRFRQSPEDKLTFVTDARAAGRRILMVGDGLNDAGALAAADVGLAVSDDTACVVPACDGLIAGNRLSDLPLFLRYARRARAVVLICFGVSVAYNVVGLTLALSGTLTPLASAVLMPVSSITIIGISSGLMRWSARRMLPP